METTATKQATTIAEQQAENGDSTSDQIQDPQLRKAIELTRTAFPEGHSQLASPLTGYGRALAARGGTLRGALAAGRETLRGATTAGRAHLRAETAKWLRYAETVSGILTAPQGA